MNEKNQKVVRKIENGIVIDHIPAGKSQFILKLLGVDDASHETYIGRGVPSTKMGRKDFVKVVGLDLGPQEFNKIALLAPSATVNRIRNFDVVEKIKIDVPETIENILKCPNLNCITNHERFCRTIFTKIKKEPLEVRCGFCERLFQADDVVFL